MLDRVVLGNRNCDRKAAVLGVNVPNDWTRGDCDRCGFKTPEECTLLNKRVTSEVDCPLIVIHY